MLSPMLAANYLSFRSRLLAIGNATRALTDSQGLSAALGSSLCLLAGAPAADQALPVEPEQKW